MPRSGDLVTVSTLDASAGLPAYVRMNVKDSLAMLVLKPGELFIYIRMEVSHHMLWSPSHGILYVPYRTMGTDLTVLNTHA